MGRKLAKRCPRCGGRHKRLEKHIPKCAGAPRHGAPLSPMPRVHVTEDQNTLNVYRCGCGWELVTIDIHQGTTWAFEQCKKCGGTAASCFYSESVTMGREPTHEFYMPDEAEFQKLHPLEKEHCAKGGLLLREINKPGMRAGVGGV